MTSGKQEKLKKHYSGNSEKMRLELSAAWAIVIPAMLLLIDNNTFSFENLDNPEIIIGRAISQRRHLIIGTNAEKPVIIPEIADLDRIL